MSKVSISPIFGGVGIGLGKLKFAWIMAVALIFYGVLPLTAVENDHQQVFNLLEAIKRG